MNIKKMIPCIYLYDKKARKGLSDDTILDEDPVKLALYYANNDSDAIFVFDLSGNDDKAHDEALDCIKQICETVNVPVYGAGNIKRMEDVKKLLYAGCARVALNFSKESNVEILEEVSSKFGKDKIMVSIKDSAELSKNKESIEKYACTILFMYHKEIIDAAELCNLPYIALLPEISLEKLIEMFKHENIVGISGDVICDNVENIKNLKNILEENGIKTTRKKIAVPWSEIKTNSDGLIPVIAQDVKTDEVLMLAYMNEEAYLKTIETGRMTYFSRSRNELWVKGETSGHFQYLQSMYLDCDNDTLLCKVIQVGVACHTGNKTCFFNNLYEKEVREEHNPLKVFEEVFDVIKDRKVNPKEGSYTNYLFDKGIDKILKKLGEEATEIVIAAKNPNPNEIKYEISDFLYHCMVLMAERDVTWEEICEELAKR
ncbi:MAG: bifunctional phosphoribosyl-AMP cyclohydrolase/phosphoribosyl-ATP diphosphatase HisIE [Lachnospiraceae bacterium]|nr:bifunctional phosphoribosyl-AMP cyclohydrolase/phosphoribosyl-ATP diphosphatase HisIE [Lachnospiraceae bacterium]